MATTETAVVGAGIIGLTTALELQGLGHKVRIFAEKPPLETTSAVAGAVFYPYLAQPKDRVAGWSQRTYLRLLAEAKLPDTGVRLVPAVFLSDVSLQDPWEGLSFLNYRHRVEQPIPGYPPDYSHAYEAALPAVEPPIYLRRLQERFLAGGGAFEWRKIADWAELLRRFAKIAVCAGLGARELVGDAAMLPIRGQILKVERPEGPPEALFVEHGPRSVAYAIPRGDGLILGGTAVEGDERLQILTQETEDICRRWSELRPSWAARPILAIHVGLRPFRRGGVRLEIERLGAEAHLKTPSEWGVAARATPPEAAPMTTIVYNYGHGGAGFTLSWGCAEEAARLLGHETIHQ